jgi:Photoprotection regulator fluorescence recovery protein
MEAQMNDLKWSPTEKAVARKAFDLALTREFEAVTAEVKRRAANLENRSALWELEDYLTASRKAIDRKYDYRYSVLIMVFAYLIREGRLNEEELHGFGEDKMEDIRRIVSM